MVILGKIMQSPDDSGVLSPSLGFLSNWFLKIS